MSQGGEDENCLGYTWTNCQMEGRAKKVITTMGVGCGVNLQSC